MRARTTSDCRDVGLRHGVFRRRACSLRRARASADPASGRISHDASVKSLRCRIDFAHFLEIVMKPGLCLAALLLIPALSMASTSDAPAVAATATDAELSACMDKAGGVTMDMVGCLSTAYEQQDKRLNAEYEALRERIEANRHTALRDAQRAWIAYRDANCAFYADPDGGTLARVSANQCMVDMTAARADELTQLSRQP